jgi:hypothetical protein
VQCLKLSLDVKFDYGAHFGPVLGEQEHHHLFLTGMLVHSAFLVVKVIGGLQKEMRIQL